MKSNTTVIAVIVALVIGFIAGFTLRPVLSLTPAPLAGTGAGPALVAATTAEARGVQYFAAHLDEARHVLAGCRAGSVRGDECDHADEAVQEAEGKERFRKFMGN